VAGRKSHCFVPARGPAVRSTGRSSWRHMAAAHNRSFEQAADSRSHSSVQAAGNRSRTAVLKAAGSRSHSLLGTRSSCHT